MTEEASVLTDLIHAAPSAAIALRAPERAPLTYGGLVAQIEETGRALRALGIGAGDSVAIVIAGVSLPLRTISALASRSSR